MPLSEEELRLLEQMERALVAEDPKLASTMRGTRIRQNARRRLIIGVLVFVIGIAVLMSGAVLRIVPLGVLGFVVMLGSAYVTLTSWRSTAAGPFPASAEAGPEAGLRLIEGGKKPRKRGKSAPKSSGSMMERMEERWRRRREQGGGY